MTMKAPKVTLRQKKINGDMISLYLDYYPPIRKESGDQTRREFLGIHIQANPKTSLEKNCVKEQLQIAEAIKAQRQLSIQKQEFGLFDNFKQSKKLVEYIQELTETKRGSSLAIWISFLKHFRTFGYENLSFAELTKEHCEKFKAHLDKSNLSQNSKASYFSKFLYALKEAYANDYLKYDLAKKLKGFKLEETKREFLTNEELALLSKAECTIPVVRKISFFSAYTGLRISDIRKLTWGEITQDSNQQTLVRFRQQKTGGLESLPIHSDLVPLFGERKSPESLVFEGIPTELTINRCVQKWVDQAQISKKITFHCFRHSFATNRLSEGTSLAIISKLLGHREVKTTQIYAKVVGQDLRKAVRNMNIELGNENENP